jgi:transcription antitermination factor NusA-like protein
MAQVIDMQLMRYINLFTRDTRVIPKYCFKYNNQLIFLVPKDQISRAIGKEATNVKRIMITLRKKIRILAYPKEDSAKDIKTFIEKLVEPVEINEFEIKDDTIIISATRINKSSLIGRNRVREKELTKIIKDLLGKGFKIS